ncbi:MAG: cell surface protein SprA [Calditrichaeota bacterium]|nr:MAG: cell surface protein SprA [Calditrichota bacterium]NOG47320.1 cell surface protein SprA [Calditrichota bacterium]
MIFNFQGRRLRHFAFLVGLSLFIIPNYIFAQSSLELPQPPRTVNLFEVELFGLEAYAVDSTFFAKKPGKYKRSVSLDSTGQYITIQETMDDVEYFFPAVIDLEHYVEQRLKFNERQMVKKKFSDMIKNQKEADFGAIELDIPFRIKSKTFTRIFGSDRISLRVTGNITFDLSGRTEERSGSIQSARESQNQNSFSPKFNQTQQFTVEGKIGEKVTVSVQQNSEAVTDIDNTLKLRYDGEEDEIVEKIEAGNISLSLPSTKYVIFGGQNKGLFGLKAQMRMGNMHLTTIASIEKGEQQELKISGNSSASKSVIKDIDFIKDRYFFVDYIYRDYWENGYSDDLQQFGYVPGFLITELDVWVTENATNPDTRTGIAMIDPSLNPETVDKDDKVEGTFRKLSPDQYVVDWARGFFWVNQNIGDSDALAISYATDGADSIGTLLNTDTTGVVRLKLIKNKNQAPTDTTWNLMMRNVYSLGGSKIQQDGFEVAIRHRNLEIETQGDSTFLTLVGLDILDESQETNPDNKIDANGLLVDLNQGTLIFPNLTPFDPPDNTKYNGLSKDYRVPVYDVRTSDTKRLQDSSKFEIIVNSKSTKSTFDLGFYVLEGSEVVTLNGKTLQRDKDYSIDYFSGQLTLESNEAKRSSSEIDIKYERANLFQLDKKTILGGRLEYKFLDNSFIGATALYMSKSTVDRRVRVGQEPFENFVWDLNAAFKFKPRFLTEAMDALPFIETSAESQFNIEGEFAQVIPEPNTLNNASTGDNNGVAYIDDFEASKRSTTLGIRYRTWTMASAPERIQNFDPGDNFAIAFDSTRANLTWFNPYNQVAIKSIWPKRDVNSQTGQTTDVLGLEYYLDQNAKQDSAWVGIMRSTASFANQQKTKYIELWVNGTEGTVHVDIGKISEDWWVRGTNKEGVPNLNFLNTEDKNINGFLEDGEDTGIDGYAKGEPGDTDEDNWSNVNQSPKDWKFPRDYRGINGTEGNSDAAGARYPDSEDLDADGQLNVVNKYFTYSFPLDPDVNHEWDEGETVHEEGPFAGQGTGWRLFRIPISEPTDVVGGADETTLQQVLNTRLRITDFTHTPEDSAHRTYIAAFDFVGNEWEETGILKQPFVKGGPEVDIKGSKADTTFFDWEKADSIFVLTTYNTEENPKKYSSPPGVSGIRDRITKARSKEQSLAMVFNEFPSGAIAEARKTLFSKLELVNYKRLKMFMYGASTDGRVKIPENPDVDSSEVTFYLRFGSDDKNFYEYGQDVYMGWNKLNKIDIDLDELASLDGFDGGEIRYLDNVPGGYYKAFGNAVSLKIIRYFVIGARNKSGHEFTGEIWLDELRLSDVRKQKATALRLKTNIKLADVLRFSGEWESKDADFHNISTQFGSGNTLERQSYTANLEFDKFLPTSWDLSIPIDARASFTRNIPKYLPRSDDLSGYQNNTFSKKVESLFGLRKLPDELKDVVSQSENIGAGTTIKKRGKSKHWLPKYTIDQLTLDFDYAQQERSSWELEYNRSRSYKERYTFKIPFSNKNYFEPFKFARTIPVLKSIWDTKIYYSPNSINLNLNVNDTKTSNLRRDSTATVKRTQNTGTTRSLSTSYRFLPKMNITYSRTHVTDADFDSVSRLDLYKGIFTKLDFGKETDVNQKFTTDYKPTLFSWLKPSFNYSSTFRYNLTSGYKYRQAVSRNSIKFGANVSPTKLVNLIYSPKGKKNTPKARRRRPKKKTVPKEGETKEPEKEEAKESSFPNPLILVYNFFDSWEKVNFNYTINENVTNQYLSDIPKWDYQLGFTQDPGVPQDNSALGEGVTVLPKPTFQEENALKTSTNVNFAKKVKVSLTHNYKESESTTNNGSTKTGGTSVSYLALGDDPLKDFGGVSKDLLRFVPEWSVNISGVEDFLFFKSFAKSISVDHGHTGKYDEKRSQGTINTQTFSNSWQPLVGLNVRTIWGVSATMRMNNSTNYSYRPSAGEKQTSQATRTTNSSFTISMNYATKAGFKIPIPVWPFKGRTFKNEINFSLTFDSSENKAHNRKTGSTKFEEQSKNSSWKLRPSATYKFNSRVQGSMFFETGATENKISGEYSYSEFGINVNIAIRD